MPWTMMGLPKYELRLYTEQNQIQYKEFYKAACWTVWLFKHQERKLTASLNNTITTLIHNIPYHDFPPCHTGTSISSSNVYIYQKILGKNQQKLSKEQNMFLNTTLFIQLEARLELLQFCMNSSRPSVTYMRQWIGSALVQIVACRLFGAKPLSKPMLVIVNWTLTNKLQWNFNQNTKLFIHENASQNIVCEMTANLSRGRWVKPLIYD